MAASGGAGWIGAAMMLKSLLRFDLNTNKPLQVEVEGSSSVNTQAKKEVGKTAEAFQRDRDHQS